MIPRKITRPRKAERVVSEVQAQRQLVLHLWDCRHGADCTVSDEELEALQVLKEAEHAPSKR